MLIVHKSLDAFGSMPGQLDADAEYQKAAAPYLNVEAAAPAFVRMDASLLRPFESMPKLELPFGGGDNARRPRIFELRTYESHSEKAARKKIEMFNSGEIAIFRRAGMSPVFFGETLIGANMPNLTYMLVYEDMAAHDKQWSAFAADPEWKKLSTTPGYTDPEIVSNISNTYLRPTAYSQVYRGKNPARRRRRGRSRDPAEGAGVGGARGRRGAERQRRARVVSARRRATS